MRRAEFDCCRVPNGQRRLGDGVESWGGACTAGVVLADGKIEYPMPEKLDVLVAMSQSALDRHLDELVPGGTLIVDSDTVASVPDRPSGADGV